MTTAKNPMRVIGLMSGTSLDGIDAALVRFERDGATLKWQVEEFYTSSYTTDQRRQIHDAIVSGDAASLCRLHADLGEWLAGAVLALCAKANIEPGTVDVIGSHGQTVWHEPPAHGIRGATLQLGCAATIAERTGIAVVSDFRTRDVAAGGHGAPLVPWADRFLFALPDRSRVLLNIGGIANLTWLPRPGAPQAILAFDTGPGNGLINAAVELFTEGGESFDRDGKLAASGEVDQGVLQELLRDPYFTMEPPKSTGRERFGKPYVEALLERNESLQRNAAAAVSTLTELTANTIAAAIRLWVLPRGADEVVVTGGGARNPEIMRRLRTELAPLPVHDGGVIGVDPDAKEAVAFAALAWAHLSGLPGNVPEATGASGGRVLGSFTPGGS